MSTQSTTLDMAVPVAKASNWRNRTIAIVLAVIIAGIFWIDSRYPALNKKYHQGTHVKVVGAITFDALYPTTPAMPLSQRVYRTTLNWLNANKIGMTFGFFFGAAALTLLATFPVRRTKYASANALIGAAAGMPLGVCANCVVPIARGFYAAGMSTESTLAAMFSSPGLNVLVLAMAFALFPLSVALIKTATVLLLIFGFAPLASTSLLATKKSAAAPEVICPITLTENDSWAQAFKSTLLSYFKSFWYILKIGLPLMLLAAVLGALAIELLPPQALSSNVSFLSHVSFLGILGVAAICAFLPVPMAFDVLFAYIAMASGVPLPYVVTILCTLGIYSIYSVLVVGKTISWKVATAAYAAVVIIGAAAGAFTLLLPH
jgi:uncharacterized membrane protein YraQ (UPF0718 family)